MHRPGPFEERFTQNRGAEEQTNGNRMHRYNTGKLGREACKNMPSKHCVWARFPKLSSMEKKGDEKPCETTEGEEYLKELKCM